MELRGRGNVDIKTLRNLLPRREIVNPRMRRALRSLTWSRAALSARPRSSMPRMVGLNLTRGMSGVSRGDGEEVPYVDEDEVRPPAKEAVEDDDVVTMSDLGKAMFRIR